MSSSPSVISMLTRAESTVLASPKVRDRVRAWDHKDKPVTKRNYAEVIKLCVPFLTRIECKGLLGLCRDVHTAVVARLIARMLVTASPSQITKAPDISIISYRLLYRLINSGPLHRVKQLYLHSPPVSQQFTDKLCQLIPQAVVVVIGFYDVDKATLNTDFEVESGHGAVAQYLNPSPVRYSLDHSPMSFAVDNLTLCNVEFSRLSLKKPILKPSKLTLMGEMDVQVMSLIDLEQVTHLAVYTPSPIALLLPTQANNIESLSLCVPNPLRFLLSLKEGYLSHLEIYFRTQPPPKQTESCLLNHADTLTTVALNSYTTELCADPWLDVHWRTKPLDSKSKLWGEEVVATMRQTPRKYPQLEAVTVDNVKYQVGRVLGDWVYTNGVCQ
ncbi:hypothetical protein DIRU0_C17172 [Diutina rugosa]